MLTPWKESYNQPGQHIKKTETLLCQQRSIVKAMVFPVAMYRCESWTIKKWVPKNWCFWTWGWRRLLRVPWTARRSNQSILKEINQSWVFSGRTDAEAEMPIFWPPDAKNSFIGKDPYAGKDWRLEETGTTEDEVVGWHHRLNGHGFGWTPWVCDGQGGLACCSPWGHKESDMTEQLNWTEVMLWYGYRNHYQRH